MAKTIPQLTDATTVNASDELIIQQSGITKRATIYEASNTVNVKQFGAIGDGTTPDSAAIQAAVNFAIAQNHKSQVVYFPPGRYLIDTRIVANLPNVSYENGITFQGAGQAETHLIASTNNSVGVLEIVGNGNQEVMSVKDLRVTSSLTNESATNNGTAILIRSSIVPGGTGWGSKPNFSALVDNVYVGGDAINSAQQFLTGNWLNGVVFQYVRRPVITNCYIQTCREPDVPTGNNYAAITFTDCYEYYADHIFVGGRFDAAIYAGTVLTSGKQFEGGNVSRSTLVGQFNGVVHNHALAPTYTTGPGLYEVGLFVQNCHINAHNYGVWLNYTQQALLSGLYLFPPAENVQNFSGNGSTTLFSKAYNAGLGLLKVYVNEGGTWVLKTEGTDFTKTQTVDGGPLTGTKYVNVTFNTPPPVGTNNVRIVTSERSVELGASIYLQNAANISVVGNQFSQTGAFRDLTSASCGVLLASTAQGCLISGNIFNHGGIGVYNAATAKNSNVVTANCFDQGQKSWGTAFVPIHDPNRTLLVVDADAEGGSKNKNYRIFTNNDDAGDCGLVLHRSREDYASTSTALLGSVNFSGWKSDKSEASACLIEPRWLDNTANEYSALRCYVKRNGSRAVSLDMNGGSASIPQYASFGASEIRANDGLKITSGTGSPEGNVAADVGSLYMRKDGAASTTLYVKTSGTGNTGWTAK